MSQGPSVRRQYRIDGIVGRGAFGTVYKAEYLGEEGFTRQVAIKFLNPDRQGFAEFTERLRDEARLLGLLRHRAIVHVDGLVYLDGRWTVVMEYIDGCDLQKVLTRGSMPIGPSLEVVGEVASALNVAYWTRNRTTDEPLRLLHRDIKPSNILLTSAGEVKVVDFGVARAEFQSREADTDGTRFGALAFMAPERLEFIDGPEGDVYALGCVLYELLAGKPLGRTSIHPERHAKRINEAMRELHKEKPHLSTALKGFLSSMLEYEPSKRPSSRETEQRCREFRGGEHSIWLREWAEVQVPSLVPPVSNCELTGTVFREGGARDGTVATPPTQDSLASGPSDPLDSYLTGSSAAPRPLTPTPAMLPPRQGPESLDPPGDQRHPTLIVPEDQDWSEEHLESSPGSSPTPPTLGGRELHQAESDEPPVSEVDFSVVTPPLEMPRAFSPRLQPPPIKQREYYQAPDPWRRYQPLLFGLLVVLALPLVGTLVMWMLWLTSC